MACIGMAFMVLVYIVMAPGETSMQVWPIYLWHICSCDLSSYGLCSYGLCNYDLYIYDLHSYGLYIATVMAYIGTAPGEPARATAPEDSSPGPPHRTACRRKSLSEAR